MADKQPLSQTQKAGALLLLFFGVLAIGFGLVQLRSTIYGPFFLRPSEDESSADLLLDETARLQLVDTDKDGINDYEELNFYDTSPYLPDTDSDGTGDKEEIEKGEDPLCPSGTVCGAALPEAPSEIKTPLEESAKTPADLLAGSIENPEDLEAILSNPEEIRRLLEQTGRFSKEQIAGIDDATLLNLVKEILAETATSTVGGTSDQ